jgi:hypothetical protein
LRVIEHDQLHECPGFLRPFPLSGAFARAQPHDGAANADAFAGFQRNVAHQPVAFVEEAEHGDSLRHRGYARIGIFFTLCDGDRPRFGKRSCLFRFCGRGALLPVATSQREHRYCRDRG